MNWADHGSHSYHRGEMDIQEQAATFHAVVGLAKWGSLSLAVFLTMTVIWFCVGAGFFPAFVVSLIVLGLGVLVLRDKGGSGH